MKFYSFGEKHKPVILLLPGTACHWECTFEHVIPLLTKDFHVVCVSYDGFDETEDTIFPDMLTETGRIEAYIAHNFNGSICAAYGCSLGGSFVALFVQRGQIHIDHAIIGSSDFDQSWKFSAVIKGKLITGIITKMLHDGKLPRWMQRRVDRQEPEKQAYFNHFMQLFFAGGRMKFVQKQSVYNQFVSDLITPVDHQIDVPGTTVHCFYAVKMGQEYEKRYRQHFHAPNILYHNYQHEELLLLHPDMWTAEVKKCCFAEEAEEYDEQ